MRSIKATRSIVILPTEVRVGYVAEVAAAGARARRINRSRQRVVRAQSQIAEVGAEVNLESVVVRIGFVGCQVDGVKSWIRQSGRRVVLRALNERAEVGPGSRRKKSPEPTGRSAAAARPRCIDSWRVACIR